MDKVDFKKKYKNIYSPSSKKPTIIEIPPLQYAVLEGTGNPNTSESFSKSIEALYGLSYTISMSYKNEIFKIPNFFNYVVPPLEGVWDIVDGIKYEKFNKDNLKWTIGIMQPDFVTEEVFNAAKELAFSKKKLELTKDLSLRQFDDGYCCTFMHIGPYDNEKESFDKMEEYAKAQNYVRIEKTHREIYISDFRKVEPEKLKTVLRFKINKS